MRVYYFGTFIAEINLESDKNKKQDKPIEEVFTGGGEGTDEPSRPAFVIRDFSHA